MYLLMLTTVLLHRPTLRFFCCSIFRKDLLILWGSPSSFNLCLIVLQHIMHRKMALGHILFTNVLFWTRSKANVTLKVSRASFAQTSEAVRHFIRVRTNSFSTKKIHCANLYIISHPDKLTMLSNHAFLSPHISPQEKEQKGVFLRKKRRRIASLERRDLIRKNT